MTPREVELVEALLRYGRHTHPCAGVWYRPSERVGRSELACTCGLDRVLEGEDVFPGRGSATP